SERPWQFVKSRPRSLEGPTAHAVLLALNPSILLGSDIGLSLRSRLRWLLADQPPLYRHGLLEIPLYTPLDCDLLGLPDPASPSSSRLLQFAEFALRTCLSRGAPLTLLTFHDWIISTGNRTALLDALLSFISDSSLESTTVGHCWPKLT